MQQLCCASNLSLQGYDMTHWFDTHIHIYIYTQILRPMGVGRGKEASREWRKEGLGVRGVFVVVVAW